MIKYTEIINLLNSIKLTNRPRIEELDYIDRAIDNLNLAKLENERYDNIHDRILEEIRNTKEIDINLTQLVEDICSDYQVDFDNGPLDDETHWIWSLASQCVDEIKEETNDY
jgi:hypothetical protein